MGVVCVTVLCKIKRLAVPVSFDYLLIPENRQKMCVRKHPTSMPSQYYELQNGGQNLTDSDTADTIIDVTTFNYGCEA